METLKGKIVVKRKVTASEIQSMNVIQTSRTSSQVYPSQNFAEEIKNLNKTVSNLSSIMEQLAESVRVNIINTSSLSEILSKVTEQTHQNTKNTSKLAQSLTKMNDFTSKISNDITILYKLNQQKKIFLNEGFQNIKNQIRLNNSEEREHRDRQVLVDLPNLTNYLEKQQIQMWTSKLCEKVFSSAFHKYRNQFINLDQAKAYCAQNIMNNIILLFQKNQKSKQSKLNADSIRWIDEHIKQKVAPYMLMKYPLTDSNVVNKELQSCVKDIDNMQNLNCNMFYKFSQTCFDFKYRQNKNYNDLIMKFVNFLLEYLDNSLEGNLKYIDPLGYRKTQQNKKNDLSLYQQFSEKMKNIFEGEDPAKQSRENKDNSYNWSISRKVQKNVPMYTKHQIQNEQFQIKHPSVLRILMKWCLQLLNKFEQDYFSNNFDLIFSSQGKKIINVCDELRNNMNKALKEEKKELTKFFKKMQQNKFQHLALRIEKALDANKFTSMSKLQRSNGLFTVNTIEALHLDLIAYLNQIIHSLLRVAKKVATSIESLRKKDYIPNLLSFSVGDLMRCRYTAKQCEIKRIYDKVLYNNELKVVRIKNRLRDNTNDIQILFLFEKSYLCQMQLVVDSPQTKQMQYTNKFNHFIYELKRSIFGPISQLCSVRNNFDKRCKIYKKMAEQYTQQSNQKPECTHDPTLYKDYTIFFNCSVCRVDSTRLSCFHKHKYCGFCRNNLYKEFIICGRCMLKRYNKEALKNILSEGLPPYDQQLQLDTTPDQIPKYGILLPINLNTKKYQEFYATNSKQKYHIYVPKDPNEKKEFIKLHELSIGDVAKFKKNCFIFKFKKTPDSWKNIQDDDEIKTCQLKSTVQRIAKKQKQVINLMKKGIDSKFASKILQQLTDCSKIKLLDLSNNDLTEINFLNKFTQLKRLFLSHNKLINVNQIRKFTYLEVLFINNNKINQFPQQVTELSQLKELDISQNKFTLISQKISLLKRLQKLTASSLKLTQLPQSLKQLQNLKQINLNDNKFAMIPNELKPIKSLQILQMSQNQIKQIGKEIAEFPLLKVLDLKKNVINNLPPQIENLNYLQKLQLNQNYLTQINLKLPSSLKHLHLNENNITIINDHFFDNVYKTFICLKLSNNKLKGLPAALSKCENLQILDLSVTQPQKSIQIKKQGLQIKNLRKLKKLNLSGLKEVCNEDLPHLNYITTLQELNLSNMNLSTLPKITDLKNLQNLNISKNNLEQLSYINKDYHQELSILDISDNKLTMNSTQLFHSFPKLKSLTHGNGLSIKTQERPEDQNKNDQLFNQSNRYPEFYPQISRRMVSIKTNQYLNLLTI